MLEFARGNACKIKLDNSALLKTADLFGHRGIHFAMADSDPDEKAKPEVLPLSGRKQLQADCQTWLRLKHKSKRMTMGHSLEHFGRWARWLVLLGMHSWRQNRGKGQAAIEMAETERDQEIVARI